MTTASTAQTQTSFDLSQVALRDLNAALHAPGDGHGPQRFRVANPGGRHAIAVGLTAPLEVDVDGHVGYYCAGMNMRATVRVHGNAGVGVAENMMSGTVIVDGSASSSAGATAHGGLLVIGGDASARCGISMKGVDIVVRGSIGHMGAFMGQKVRSSYAAIPVRRWGIPCTRPASTSAGPSRAWAPTAWRRRWATSTAPRCAACSGAPG